MTVARPIRLHVVVAASYFVYTCLAAAFLILMVAIGSQGASGCMVASLVFAIALTSPLPMVLVGFAFLRRWRGAVLMALALALMQALATVVQLRMARGNVIGVLDIWRSAVYYLCFAQTFYLPGSLLLAPLSCLTLLRRS